ncbi:hypothetical protein SAMN05444682_102295 [Parapedobacter indicus]|uniref:Uncharacterized protein n=1 Tax=Parapedobacter indicus TaxID=1477437 RepID=A0A1I3FFD5_9SPHI|nr:hypothetical protein CLV26_102295 [Parapedobacter indicus]SFI09641.1 hypothetical protein SAMN05444682_102295 [Parapedobacter indicus]
MRELACTTFMLLLGLLVNIHWLASLGNLEKFCLRNMSAAIRLFRKE